MKSTYSDDFLADFLESIPHKPYCTEDLGVTYIRQKKTAIGKRYLQINPPTKIIYLVFDIDRFLGALAWEDCGLPPPHWSATNPENCYAHLGYKISVPVCTSDFANRNPIRYLAAIQSAMCEKLGADRGYAGLLTKNPLHKHWKVMHWIKVSYAYSLEELARWVDLTNHPKKGPEAHGYGRNCDLFESARKWAYKEIRAFWKPEYKANWNDAVYDHVESLNGQFISPLPASEVKSIAKSIANWTFKNFSPGEFRRSQARKGAKGSREDKVKAGSLGGYKSKGGGRPDKKKLLPRVLEMQAQGHDQTAIAERLGLNQSTVSRWLKTTS